jgi:hypothetical protein
MTERLPKTKTKSSPDSCGWVTQELDRRASVFHICSHGSRDARRGAEPWLEGAYALRQWLPAGNQIHAEVRLSQAAGPRDAGSHERA